MSIVTIFFAQTSCRCERCEVSLVSTLWNISSNNRMSLFLSISCSSYSLAKKSILLAPVFQQNYQKLDKNLLLKINYEKSINLLLRIIKNLIRQAEQTFSFYGSMVLSCIWETNTSLYFFEKKWARLALQQAIFFNVQPLKFT